MSVFEFTLTLYSIVIALGVARVLTGYVALIEYRKETPNTPLFFVWFSFLLLTHIVWWFSLWGLNATERLSLILVLFLFHIPAFLFIATRLLIPSESELSTIGERFAKLRIPFLLSFSVPFIFGPLFQGIGGDWATAIYLIPAGALLVAGTSSPNIRLQYFVAVGAFLIFLAFAAQFRSFLAG